MFARTGRPNAPVASRTARQTPGGSGRRNPGQQTCRVLSPTGQFPGRGRRRSQLLKTLALRGPGDQYPDHDRGSADPVAVDRERGTDLVMVPAQGGSQTHAEESSPGSTSEVTSSLRVDREIVPNRRWASAPSPPVSIITARSSSEKMVKAASSRSS